MIYAMRNTSEILGTFRISVHPSVRRLAAIIGSTAFFEPWIFIFPRRGLSP